MKQRRPKVKTKKESTHSTHTRMRVVFGVMLVLLIIAIGRLYFLQSGNHEKYVDKAARQQTYQRVLQANRGTLFFSGASDTEYPVAINRSYARAFVSEPDVPNDDKDAVSQRIAAELGVDEDMVRAKFEKEGDLYEVVARKITPERRDEIRSLRIPGLHFEPEVGRYYPGETLGAHVVGFVGSTGESLIGRYGAEASFEGELLGTAGHTQTKRDARGGWNSIADRILTPHRDGTSVVLSIEYAVQQEVEKILAQDTELYGAEKGSAIVMEVATGRILAMAQVPTFSLNDYGKTKDQSLFRNTSISEPYESGSVFKTFTIAMGLDAGVISPNTTYVDRGFVQADIYKLRNSEDKVYGLQTMTKVLEDSINTGVIYVERLLGNTRFKEYTEQFGFGTTTNIELPAEALGNLRNLSDLRRTVEYYTASFGQGITVTPIQLVAAYGALANGGMMMQPTIIKERIAPNGTRISQEPQELRRVVSQQASDQTSEMLYQVVAGGHAALAAVPGYRVGGKTGTAQVARTDGPGYDPDRKNTTFVGYGPIAGVDDPETTPEYVVFVKYNNPVNVEWAATSASPTFGRIMSFLFDYKKVVPTEEITVKKNIIDIQNLSD